MNQPMSQGQMYYGQDAVESARALPGFANVRQKFELYDRIRIGSEVPTNVNGWFPDFTTMSASGESFSFFNQRQESETTKVYTNMKKKTGLDWPVIFTSVGIEFIYPDPVNVDMYDGDRCVSKMFSQFIKNHSVCEIFTGGADDKLLTALSAQLPMGYGMVSNQAAGTLVGYAGTHSNGVAMGNNRGKFPWALALPKDISLELRLTLAKRARDMLTLMATVQPIVFANGTFANEAMIEVCFEGFRDVQQVGNYTR